MRIGLVANNKLVDIYNSVKEAADDLGISTRAVYRAINEGGRVTKQKFNLIELEDKVTR